MSYFFDKMLIKNEKNSYNLLIYLWFLLTKNGEKKDGLWQKSEN